MSLTTPPSVEKLQTALHAKAMESPNFRFYALYDKVYREGVREFLKLIEVRFGLAGVDAARCRSGRHAGVCRFQLTSTAQPATSR
jgi:RNA-directed DNA polymerase